MDNTYCPYCRHRVDKYELTDEGLREELARRLYPDAEEAGGPRHSPPRHQPAVPRRLPSGAGFMPAPFFHCERAQARFPSIPKSAAKYEPADLTR